jgi:rhodanese-related sulfurtransferase
MKNTKIKLFAALLLSSSTLYSCAGNSQPTTIEAQNSIEQVAEVPKATVQNISQEEFLKIQSQENTIVMDVRTAGEVAEGYIHGATVFADVTGNTFQNDIAALDKNKTYLVYCKSGARSSRAAQMMVDAGFTNVYNLNGGISNWSGPTAK